MNPLAALFASQTQNPMAAMQAAIAQTWFQMGMPPPEMFMSFLMQAMQNPGYGQQMSPFLNPFANPMGGGGGPRTGATVHVGMDGVVNAQGSSKAEILRTMTGMRDRLQTKYGDQDPRVIGLNGAIRGLTPQVRAEGAVVRDHRDHAPAAPIVRDHR